MPMLAGGSDIYKAPMAVRAADALGLFDAFKGEPEPERMAEPMASALARQVESQYATPDLSERVTAEMLIGADPVPSRVPEGLPRPPRGRMASMFPPEYDRQVAASRAGIGEFFSDLSDQYAEGRARDMEFIAGGGRRVSKPGLEPATPIDEILEVAQQSQTDASNPRPPLLAAGDVLAPYTDYESVMNVAERNGDMDFSIMDDYFANLNTGDKSVQGESPVQTQAKPPPKLEIDDILDESRRMTQANMLMQLGAGIAGGDLSKGISAAGAAGMKGAQEQRDLDIRKRLAEYQAGREDIARGEKSKQFYDQLKVIEKRYDNDLAKAASVGRNELFRTASSLVEAAVGESYASGAERQAMVEALMSKYLSLYAPTFGVTDIPTMPPPPSGEGRRTLSSFEGG